MTRDLFLDDDEERICIYLRRQAALHPDTQVDVARTASEAIRLLETNRYDLLDLDHDLDHKVFVDSDDPNCGMEVVRWMVKHQPEVGSIVVHSYNFGAAQQMEEKLREGGYDVVFEPFPYGSW